MTVSEVATVEGRREILGGETTTGIAGRQARVLCALGSLSHLAGDLQPYLRELAAAVAALVRADCVAVTLSKDGYERVLAGLAAGGRAGVTTTPFTSSRTDVACCRLDRAPQRNLRGVSRVPLL
jgi:predicted transcriptional regulator